MVFLVRTYITETTGARINISNYVHIAVRLSVIGSYDNGDSRSTLTHITA